MYHRVSMRLFVQEVRTISRSRTRSAISSRCSTPSHSYVFLSTLFFEKNLLRLQIIEYNFYCANHGKSACDSHTGVYKNACRRKMMESDDVEFHTARDIAGTRSSLPFCLDLEFSLNSFPLFVLFRSRSACTFCM